jgi:hypothetical protein
LRVTSSSGSKLISIFLKSTYWANFETFGEDWGDYLVEKPIRITAHCAVGIADGSNDKAGVWHNYAPLRAMALPLRERLHRATVKGKLHSCHGRIGENAVYGVGIEDFQTEINARRHDLRGTRSLKIDSVTRFFPRPDGASISLASDVISIGYKAAAELFGKLSKADFIAFFDKDLFALVGASRPGSVQIESVCL